MTIKEVSESISFRSCGGGEGEARVTVLALHTTWMHVDLSFSYLRFAEAASFDKKDQIDIYVDIEFM
jgi:hypothetical protein